MARVGSLARGFETGLWSERDINQRPRELYVGWCPPFAHGTLHIPYCVHITIVCPVMHEAVKAKPTAQTTVSEWPRHCPISLASTVHCRRCVVSPHTIRMHIHCTQLYGPISKFQSTRRVTDSYDKSKRNSTFGGPGTFRASSDCDTRAVYSVQVKTEVGAVLK